jgi:hypothetical protein
MPVIVMMPEIHRHMDTEKLERYSLGGIPQREAERIEEHLLLCEVCRRRLEETELYIASMRRAATEIRRRPQRQWRLIPILTFAACVILLVVGVRSWGLRPQPAFAVNLVATRAMVGRESVPAGSPLWLHPDLTGLAPAPSYRLEVVDHNGKQIWNGVLAASEGGTRIPPQRAGAYYVRMYATTGEILREYGLEIR